MQIRLATYADKEAWDGYVLNHSEGTAYQLSAWKEAVEASYKFRGNYLLAEKDSGICGVLPLIDFRPPLIGRQLISLPYCDSGGVLSDSPDIEQSLITHACSMAREVGAGLKIRSTKKLLHFGENRTDKVSMLLDIPDSSEQLLSDFKSKFRLKIKKPARDGFTSVVGQSELLDDFYAVFSENMRDLGSPVHARIWLQSIIAAYGDRVLVAVVYAPYKIPAAAGMLLLHPSRVSNPWASSLRRYNSMRPNMLLYWTLLAYAADNGYRQFDFGRSTPGEGTDDFKQQCGAEPRSLYWYEIGNSPTQEGAPSRLQYRPPGSASHRRQLAASLWKRLPQSGTDWLGPKIRKYIPL